MVINVSWFQYLAVLGSIIIGLTGLKVASCSPFKEGGDTFEFKKFFVGLLGNLLVALTITCTYVICSTYGGDLAVININDTAVTIQAALDMVMLAVIAMYGVKLIKNLLAYAGVAEDKIGTITEAPVQTTFNTDDIANIETENVAATEDVG